MHHRTRILFILLATTALIGISLFFQHTYVSGPPSECALSDTPTLFSCWQEVLSRSALHALGGASIALLLFTARPLLSRRATYLLTFAIGAYFAVQEFYLHPLWYGQPLFKGVADFLSWTIPMLLYFLIQWRHAVYSKP